MSLNEKGTMYLAGKIQNGVFEKNKGLFKGRNKGGMEISSNNIVFDGLKNNIEFNVSDIKSIELIKGNKRILFNLYNGDVYAFSCFDTNIQGIDLVIDISFIRLMKKKNEALYNLLEEIIIKKVSGEDLKNNIRNYNTIQTEIGYEAQKVKQKQIKRQRSRRNAGIAECLCECLLPLIFILILVLIFFYSIPRSGY